MFSSQAFFGPRLDSGLLRKLVSSQDLAWWRQRHIGLISSLVWLRLLRTCLSTVTTGWTSLRCSSRPWQVSCRSSRGLGNCAMMTILGLGWNMLRRTHSGSATSCCAFWWQWATTLSPSKQLQDLAPHWLSSSSPSTSGTQCCTTRCSASRGSSAFAWKHPGLASRCSSSCGTSRIFWKIVYKLISWNYNKDFSIIIKMCMDLFFDFLWYIYIHLH